MVNNSVGFSMKRDRLAKASYNMVSIRSFLLSPLSGWINKELENKNLSKECECMKEKNTTLRKPVQSGAYFDMIEYFCNGHDDTAVDVISYDCNGIETGRKIFSWSNGSGEVTSEGIWRKADEFAHQLMQNGITLRHRKPI